MTDGKLALGLMLIGILVGALCWLPIMIQAWMEQEDD